MNMNKYADKIIAESKIDSEWIKEAEYYENNKEWLDDSFKIALAILKAIKEQNITQVILAERLKCSKQYVNTLVKGKENFTIEKIRQLEKALNIKLMQICTQFSNSQFEINKKLPEFSIDKHKSNEVIKTQATKKVISPDKKGKIIYFHRNHNQQYANAM